MSACGNLAYLLSIVPGPDQPFKICIPDALLNNNIIIFYHLALNHVEITRLTNTAIAMYFYHPGLQGHVASIIPPCSSAYQEDKLPCQGHGQLPPTREADVAPWQEVTEDLLDPGQSKYVDKITSSWLLRPLYRYPNYPEIFASITRCL